MQLHALLAVVGCFLVALARAARCVDKGIVSCSAEVPPCLQACLTSYGLCTACGINRASVLSCVANVCGELPGGQKGYADTYFHSLCAADAYVSGHVLYSVSASCGEGTEGLGLVTQGHYNQFKRRPRKRFEEGV